MSVLIHLDPLVPQNSSLLVKELHRVGIQLHIERISSRQVLVDLAILGDGTTFFALVVPLPMQ